MLSTIEEAIEALKLGKLALVVVSISRILSNY